MAMSLDEFHDEFFQDIVTSADADGQFKEDVFFEQFCSHLLDAGEIESADRAPYLRAAGGMRVDGYGGDPVGGDGTLTLIICDFNQSPEVGRLVASEMDAIFKRLSNFLNKALDERFRNALEETSPAFGLADLIASRWKRITRVRLILISNRQLSARVDGREAEEVDGRPMTFSVWDIERLYRFATARQGREEIVIDLEEDFGGGIRILPAHLMSGWYEAYIAVVPATQLAAIYDKWGARLLEQNVRVFLQARGAVNKGIRNTIDEEPSMFFAYNNGITATAESIEIRTDDGGLLLTKLRNFQIVNGGQTTASIHAAFRRKSENLAKVFVQMKLSIVEPEVSNEVVPKISEFANSQNRVNAADFFSNHPFHVRMEDFSRRILAPSRDGTFRQSKWFYERARGQYADARARMTPAQRKKFDLEHPKKQVFTKTDLAKYQNVWLGHPDVVSKGAQKNFAHFAHSVGRAWTKSENRFNEGFFRESVAKAILFRETEKIVTEAKWYQGGYRANIVAYALAKMGHDAREMNRSPDFEKIWRQQGVSPATQRAIAVAAEAVHRVLISPPTGISNVTEWAKQQGCWKQVQSLSIDWPAEWKAELVGGEEVQARKRSDRKDQKTTDGIEAQALVVNAGAETWRELLAWGSQKRLLSPDEARALSTASAMPSKLPNEVQARQIVAAMKRMHREGCQVGRDLVA